MINLSIAMCVVMYTAAVYRSFPARSPMQPQYEYRCLVCPLLIVHDDDGVHPGLVAFIASKSSQNEVETTIKKGER